MAKTKDFSQITFPDKKEYERFEELIMKGTPEGDQEAWKMIKNKRLEKESKRRRRYTTFSEGAEEFKSGGLW